MNIEELYAKLKSKGFQDPEKGDLFYNFFIYQYPPQKEYEIRHQIEQFKQDLKRPSTYVDVLSMNIFDEFCKYLDGQRFLKHPSKLRYLIEKEQSDPTGNERSVSDTLTRNANDERFVAYLHSRIMEHIGIEDEMHRPFVFMYGFGAMYPYLRVNNLLSLYEKYNETSRYKILVFYPGHFEQNSFRLFDTLEDEHTYRATLLVNELE